MREDVQELLDAQPSGLWVGIDVAMEALGVKKRRAYQLLKSEGWRTQGPHINFEDIVRTWHHRKETA